MSAKRKQIISAAHQLFVDKGFALTSIQDILDKAGIAKGTFYNYFESKNQCLKAILESISEQVEQERREIAIGKEMSDEEVFIEQVTVRIKMNRQHHLLTVFETVSFSEDSELKLFMEEQHRAELQWIGSRFNDLYPDKAQDYTLDYAVIFTGITHHLILTWKLGSSQELDIEKVIRYALNSVKSLSNNQSYIIDPFLPVSWLDGDDNSKEVDITSVIKRLEELNEQLTKQKGTSKQKELTQFFIAELQKTTPRAFLLEGVIMSTKKAFHQTRFEHEVKQITEKIWKIIQ
ncbi:TetR/AcrR family transcriptional regulator [Aquibacillus koreensis]|uniref:TetR/AcrR family transcriptional regulator n=1 Tax=Aquibacillus koreensis TaxID=279446 RepID=A0A9X3WLW0_9BACI|nr:TetR/AcrR family transcriptional regulator [Aquibacillus koreensis]MCT2535149.1 TetR/AcrR family transcriptional regulator [Aquibacillus koreensis]MDC3421008.1 TetR/AcrR family transcriptional regulator [Aquibacillus koreensis]